MTNKLSDEMARELALKILTRLRYCKLSAKIYCSPPDDKIGSNILDLRGYGMLTSPNGYGLSNEDAMKVGDIIGEFVVKAVNEAKAQEDGLNSAQRSFEKAKAELEGKTDEKN